MDVPSPDAGVIEKLHVKKGARVSAGAADRDAAATMRRYGRSAAPPPAGSVREPQPAAAGRRRPSARGEPAPAAGVAAASRATSTPHSVPAPSRRRAPRCAGGRRPRLPPINEVGFARAHASPSVRKFARELGADLARVQGSGQKGRITAEDVKAFVKSCWRGRDRRGSGGGGAAGGGAADGVACRTSRSSGPSRSSR